MIKDKLRTPAKYKQLTPSKNNESLNNSLRLRSGLSCIRPTTVHQYVTFDSIGSAMQVSAIVNFFYFNLYVNTESFLLRKEARVVTLKKMLF